MNQFRSFGIQPETSAFSGDKISIKKILNLPIVVLDYKVGPSSQKQGTECLTLQIEKNGEKRIVFTGSKVLINMIQKVQSKNFPFTTTIKQDNEYYEFT